jgi:hypothetical protein
MKYAGVLFGVLILAGVFVVWFRAYKSIKSDRGLLSSIGTPNQKTNSLDEFIASYKRGEVTLENKTMAAQLPGAAVAKAANPGGLPAAVTPAASAVLARAPMETGRIKCEAFISGAAKLAYLTAKAGLRDHHIFAHVQLSALSTGSSLSEPLSQAGADLVICNAAMAPVAAVDLIDAAGGQAPAAKAEHLRMLGIRYLRLSVKSLPRPDEWRALLYKM